MQSGLSRVSRYLGNGKKKDVNFLERIEEIRKQGKTGFQ